MRIKNSLKSFIKLTFFSLALVSATAFADQTTSETSMPVYAQLSSFKTQMPAASEESNELSLEDNSPSVPGPSIQSAIATFEKKDGLSGLGFVDNKKIVIQEAGVYFISATGSVGTKTAAIRGNVYLSIAKNGKKLTYSNVGGTVINNLSSYALTSQVSVALNEGDIISIVIGSNSPLLGVIGDLSSSPSIKLTVFKL